MVNYTTYHGPKQFSSTTSIHCIFPAITNSWTLAAVGRCHMQFSLNESSWKPVSQYCTCYYAFNGMKKTQDSICIFRLLYVGNFAKQMKVNMAGSAMSTCKIYSAFRSSTTSPGLARYNFLRPNALFLSSPVISISVTSPMNLSDTVLEARRRVGLAPFRYIVTAGGKGENSCRRR